MKTDLNFPKEQILFSQVQIARIADAPRMTINRRVHSILTKSKKKADKSKLPTSKKCDLQLTRKTLEPFFAEYKKNIIHKINMFYNFKGGTGKTSVCYQLSTILSFMGFNVLAIDCDPQAHLSSMFGLPENHNHPTVYDAMINERRLQDLIINAYEGLDLIPSALSLTKIEIPLNLKLQRENVLSRILQGIPDKYDFVMVDANPAFSMLNLNILMASDHLNVVCETQPFSLLGLTQMIEELDHVFKQFKKELNYHIIPNKFEAKTAAAQEVLGALRKDYRDETTQSIIRKCEDINLSTKKRLPALCFSGKNSSATEDLLDLTREFLELTTGKKRIEAQAAA